jgi:hypothetical protein
LGFYTDDFSNVRNSNLTPEIPSSQLGHDLSPLHWNAARGQEEGKTKIMLIKETKKAPPGRCLWFDAFGLVLNYRAAV